MAKFGLGAVARLILASKVTSPQYDLWLMPFLALAAAPAWLVGAFVATDLAYFWSSYQTLYTHFGGQSELATTSQAMSGAINAARQAMLLGVLI